MAVHWLSDKEPLTMNTIVNSDWSIFARCLVVYRGGVWGTQKIPGPMCWVLSVEVRCVELGHPPETNRKSLPQ
jgi:hypothetical protein